MFIVVESLSPLTDLIQVTIFTFEHEIVYWQVRIRLTRSQGRGGEGMGQTYKVPAISFLPSFCWAEEDRGPHLFLFCSAETHYCKLILWVSVETLKFAMMAQILARNLKSETPLPLIKSVAMQCIDNCSRRQRAAVTAALFLVPFARGN